LQIIEAVLAQPALAQHPGHFHRQRVGARGQHLPAVDRQMHQHRTLGEIGVLEVEPHPIGEHHLADAKVGLAPVAGDLACRAEIGVGEGAGGVSSTVGSCALAASAQAARSAFLAARGRAAAHKADQRPVERFGIGLQRGQHHGGGDGAHLRVQPGLFLIGRGGDAALAQQVERGLRQRARRDRVIARGRRIDRRAQHRHLFGDFGRDHPLRQRAAHLGDGGQHRLPPVAVHRIDVDRGFAPGAENVGGGIARGAKWRIQPPRHMLQPPVDDAVADGRHQPLAPVGPGVGLITPRPRRTSVMCSDSEGSR
jgi:hypothetical protein